MFLHIGRDWAGTVAEQRCPCPRAECGLADGAQLDPECAIHSADDAIVRQMHAPTACPGSSWGQPIPSHTGPITVAMELHAVMRLAYPDAATREAIRRYQQASADEALAVVPIELSRDQQLREAARQVLTAVAGGSFAPTLRTRAGRIARQITELNTDQKAAS